jgi:hypothetical protein
MEELDKVPANLAALRAELSNRTQEVQKLRRKVWDLHHANTLLEPYRKKMKSIRRGVLEISSKNKVAMSTEVSYTSEMKSFTEAISCVIWMLFA